LNLPFPPPYSVKRKHTPKSKLSGGLALVIRSGETPEKQGEMMTKVVEYLESELINVDSFSDAYFYKKVDNPKNNP